LQREELDLAVTSLEKKSAAGVRSVALVELPLVLLVHKNSDITSAEDLWKRDRIQEPLICLPSTEAVSKNFQQGLGRKGVDWFPSIEVSSLDLVETYVANGFGVGVGVAIPKVTVSNGVRQLGLPGFEPVVVGALWRGKPSALIQAFLDEIQLRAKRLV
jgi:DNA-binding transcriptional LysR family regulator